MWNTAQAHLVSIFFFSVMYTNLSDNNRLVTLAIQNSALTLIMHHSLVSTPPSRAYSAATAVLLNEIFKGAISLAIAYTRVDISNHPSPYPLEVSQAAGSRWALVSLPRVRKLSSDIFSSDCWKLSIPAILYGTSDHFTSPHSHSNSLLSPRFQSFKITCNTLQPPIWMPQLFR
jgi:hypothetical protein